MQMIDGFPRRSRLDLHTPAEAAIRAAIDAVESAGAHVFLTDAVNLLIKAGDKVADFVEIGSEPPMTALDRANAAAYHGGEDDGL